MPTTLDVQRLAALYEYPWEKPVIDDPALATAVKPLVTFIKRKPLEELQDLFTRTFDLAPVAPPYLGFHVHGESYRRGTVMATLRELYRQYDIDEAGELPDHVAVVLRLLAAAPADDATVAALLANDLLPGLDKLLELTASDERDNPYRALLVAARQVFADRVAAAPPPVVTPKEDAIR